MAFSGGRVGYVVGLSVGADEARVRGLFAEWVRISGDSEKNGKIEENEKIEKIEKSEKSEKSENFENAGSKAVGGAVGEAGEAVNRVEPDEGV